MLLLIVRPQVDEHGMVWSQDEKLSSNKQPHFTEYEVVVADSADATIEVSFFHAR